MNTEAMRTLTVSLSPTQIRRLQEAVESGSYASNSEVVREALRLLKERDQAREHLRADVQAGFDQLARGEGRAYDKTSGRQLAEQPVGKLLLEHEHRVSRQQRAALDRDRGGR
ncbi:MAG: type II toxin-antitoxin system ParD family antitoxin [Sphingomonadales bacterium]|nr:type II toxin-antitoxin system ParD family antitoxin [Sphingomonadales bacterium]